MQASRSLVFGQTLCVCTFVCMAQSCSDLITSAINKSFKELARSQLSSLPPKLSSTASLAHFQEAPKKLLCQKGISFPSFLASSLTRSWEDLSRSCCCYWTNVLAASSISPFPFQLRHVATQQDKQCQRRTQLDGVVVTFFLFHPQQLKNKRQQTLSSLRFHEGLPVAGNKHPHSSAENYGRTCIHPFGCRLNNLREVYW